MKRAPGVLLVTLAILIGNVATAMCSLPPPPRLAQVRPVIDHYFGASVVDPYRYMENLSDPGVQAWMRAQNEYTRAVLDSIPGRAKLLAEVKRAYESAPAEVFDIRRLPSGQIFYQKRLGSGEVPKLCMRQGFKGKETLVADPLKYDRPDSPHNTLVYYSVSQDGHYVSYGTTQGGGRSVVLHVIDTTTLVDEPETIDRVLWALGFVPSVWRPDNHSFFYTRLRSQTPNAPASEVYQNSRVYLHVLGTDPNRDPAVFGDNVVPDVKMAPADLPSMVVPPGSSRPMTQSAE